MKTFFVSRRRLIELSCVLFIFPSLAGCSKKAAAPAGPPARPVIVAAVTEQDVPIYLNEIGNCVAQESVRIQAQVTGQIIARHFVDGAEVKKGDLLFSIDPRPYQAALDEAQGNLAQAQAQLKLDQLNLSRTSQLKKESVAAQQELDTAQATVSSDEAKVQNAQGGVVQAQVNLDYCNITSPIDGRAGLRQVDVGNIVSASTAGTSNSVLLTIQKFDPIYTDFTVAENDLPQVRSYLPKGNIKVQTITASRPNDPTEGTLYFIDNAVQPSTGTVKVRGVSNNPNHALWPGQFVNVKFILDTLKQAKLIPSQAIQISQKGPFIFVLKSDSTVEMRSVKLGQRQGEFIVVTEGVKTGEKVVITGQLALAPGSKVIPKLVDPKSSDNLTPSLQ